MRHLDNTKNTWENYDAPVLNYSVSLNLDKSDALEIIHYFTVQLITVSHNHKLLLNTMSILDDSINTFNHIYKYLISNNLHIPSFGDLFSSLNPMNPKGNILNFMTYYGQSGIESNYVLELMMSLRKFNFQSSALIYPLDIDLSTHYKPFVPLYCNFIKIPLSTLRNGKTQINFEICSNTSIWLQQTKKNTGLIQDNRLLSFLNTPRLNSLLRDIYALVTQLGGSWSFESEGNRIHYNMGWESDFPFESMYNDHCVPLDGKIIYQEEIDEGKVLLPEF